MTPTLIQIARDRGDVFTEGVAEACLTDAPAINTFSFRTTEGITFKTLAREGLPVASSFVDLNAGLPRSGQGDYAVRESQCFLVGGYIEVNPITARLWDRDNPTGVDFRSLRVSDQMLANFIQMERVLFYGTAIDPKAPSGLKQLTPFSGGAYSMTEDPSADDYNKSVVNVGGSAAGTASSIYAVKFGELDAQMVFGGATGNTLFQMGDTIQVATTPDPNRPTEKLVVEHTQFTGWMGLSIGGMSQLVANQTVPTQYCVRRAANVTAQAGFTCTDAMLGVLVNSMPKTPDALYMSIRSRQQLRTSRTPAQTIYVGGVLPGNSAFNYAPTPTDFEGIPIIATRHIKSNETIEA